MSRRDGDGPLTLAFRGASLAGLALAAGRARAPLAPVRRGIRP